jgi:hypothetical protein
MRLGTLAKLGAAAVAGGAAYAQFIRPWHLRWGATDEEIEMALPGDEDATGRDLFTTRAIDIDAAPEDVWPWIVQMGQTKAGMYSYRWLENLVGCKMPDVRSVVPFWQHPKVGDEVWLHPKAPPLKVLHVNPNRDFVLGNTWSFHLRPLDGGRRTRFIVRGQGALVNPDLGPIGNFAYWRVIFEPAHFVMERKMMLRIKELAEDAATRKDAAMWVGVA